MRSTKKKMKGQTALLEGEQRRGLVGWEMTLEHVCENGAWEVEEEHEMLEEGPGSRRHLAE